MQVNVLLGISAKARFGRHAGTPEFRILTSDFFFKVNVGKE